MKHYCHPRVNGGTFPNAEQLTINLWLLSQDLIIKLYTSSKEPW